MLGNLAGGRLADRSLVAAIFGTLGLLLAVLLVSGLLFTSRVGALLAVAALGFATFSTVAPLQSWVLRQTRGAAESLASSFNIAAFNLGNAIGAWIGGIALDRLGLLSLTWVAALFPLGALVAAGLAVTLQRSPVARRAV